MRQQGISAGFVMFKIGKKLKNDQGITWVVALLAILVVVAAVLIIVVPGVFNHVTDTKLTYDTKSVATAKDVALIQYLSDAPNGLVTYYYDEISHNALPREKIGTIKMYSAVINPALPEAVPRSMPNCCSSEAAHSATPHSSPLLRKYRFFGLSIGTKVPFFFFTVSITRMTGSRKAEPSSERSDIKVNGPTNCAPVDCATKELPQITAQSVKIRLPARLLRLCCCMKNYLLE